MDALTLFSASLSHLHLSVVEGRHPRGGFKAVLEAGVAVFGCQTSPHPCRIRLGTNLDLHIQLHVRVPAGFAGRRVLRFLPGPCLSYGKWYSNSSLSITSLFVLWMNTC